MTFDTVKILLDKYFEGETTLQEEATLSAYFNSENIDSRLKQFQPLFQFLKVEKTLKLSEAASYKVLNIEKPLKRLSILIYPETIGRGGTKWLQAVAAMLILTVGSFFLIKTLYTPKHIGLADSSRIKIYDENEDPQVAFEEVQAALKLVSKKMKKGSDGAEAGMKKVKHVTDDVDKIMKIN